MRDLTRFEGRLPRARQRPSEALPEDKLVAAINDSAKSVGAQSLTFFVAAAYISFSAAEVRDDFFIFHDKLNLPIANVSIPAEWFFLVAATLLTGLHLMILLHEYYLVEKLAALPWKRREVRTELFFPSISISGHFPHEYPLLVGGIGFLSFWFVYLVVPLSVLVYLQMCSLRFRIQTVEHGVSACVAITLIASIGFFILTSLVKRGSSALWGRWGDGIAGLTGALLIVGFLPWFVGSYVEMLGHPSSCEAESKFLGVFPFRRHLILTAIPERLGGEVPIRQNSGVNFRRMDLRCAVFTNVELAGIDFRGADLAGAVFDRANLNGASFSSLPFKKTNLRDASFEHSDLAHARFRGSAAIGAVFREANLQEADFSGADLSKAKMNRANLVAADLTSTRLRGADLRKALLALARLDYSSIELARFDEAWLDRASFKGAAAFGASFRGARVRRVTGLPLAGVDLQSAKVWGMNSCGALSSFPAHVNFRDLNFAPAGNWQSVLEEIHARAQMKNLFSISTWERMKLLLARPVATFGPTCFTDLESSKMAREKGWPDFLREQNILYDEPQPGTPLEEWPGQPPVTEEEYLGGLIRELIAKICAEESQPLGKGFRESTLRSLLELRAEEKDRLGQLLKQQLPNASCDSLTAPAP